MAAPGDPPERSRTSALAEGTSAGMLFLAGPVAGYFLGRWIGGAASPWPWIAGALGLVAAFVNFFRLAARLSK